MLFADKGAAEVEQNVAIAAAHAQRIGAEMLQQLPATSASPRIPEQHQHHPGSGSASGGRDAVPNRRDAPTAIMDPEIRPPGSCGP